MCARQSKATSLDVGHCKLAYELKGTRNPLRVQVVALIWVLARAPEKPNSQQPMSVHVCPPHPLFSCPRQELANIVWAAAKLEVADVQLFDLLAHHVLMTLTHSRLRPPSMLPTSLVFLLSGLWTVQSLSLLTAFTSGWLICSASKHRVV